jgi:hypothetical protein
MLSMEALTDDRRAERSPGPPNSRYVEVDMGLEERLFKARRTQCVEHLVRLGQSAELAENWCVAWEREAANRPSPPAGELFWEYGRLWIEAQIAARRSPFAVAAGR